MAVKVEGRNGRLGFRVYLDGCDSREPTALRDTPRNRERLERKATAMNDLIAEGRFDYLQWFPDGNQAARFRPAPEPEPPRVLTVEEYARGTWLPRSQPPNVRRSLAETQEEHCRSHILPLLGSVSLDAITPTVLEDVKATLMRPKDAVGVLLKQEQVGRGLAYKTARDIVDSTLRALYRDARTVDYALAFGRSEPLPADPFAVVKWIRKPGAEPDPYDEAERDALLGYFHAKKRHYVPFVSALFFTGARIGELVGLRWADVDLRRGKLHIRRSRTRSEDNAPKTKNSQRVMTMLPEVLAVLRPLAFQRVSEDSFVFITEAGTPLEAERFVEKHWRTALRACRVRPRKLYATRHTFISLALTRGVNLKWLAKYCGTSVEMIERHYGKWMDGDDGQLALLAGVSDAAREAQVA